MNTEGASTSKNAPTTSNTYDESITTSSESDTFETWTLVTEKKTPKEKSPKPTSAKINNDNNRVEVLNKLDGVAEQKKAEQKAARVKNIETKPEQDSSVEDLSDGISVISECESGGRISPNPFLREQLSNLNLKFAEPGVEFGTVRPQLTPPNSPLLPTPATVENQVRRRTNNTEPAVNDNNVNNANNGNAVQQRRNGNARGLRQYPIIRRGLSFMFYLAVAVSLLALIGRIGNPELRRMNGRKVLSELEQKFNDLSLQNNLMRAEIDLLSKQLFYLNAMVERNTIGKKELYKRATAWQQEPKSKSFKAWSGQGDSMEPVDVKKDDYKTLYKCNNGKFVEIASMCQENMPKEKPAGKKIEIVINDVLEGADAIKTLKDAAEPIDPLKENPFQKKAVYKEFPMRPEDVKKERGIDLNEEWNQKQNARRNVLKKQEKYVEKSRKFTEGLKERNSKEKFDQPNKSQLYKMREAYELYVDSDEDGEDDNDDNSRERFNKYPPKYDKAKYDENNSKYIKQRRYKDSSRERYQKAGDWHNNLMQHRENARRENDRQFNDKNWYIKRGNSRERIRVDDMQFR